MTLRDRCGPPRWDARVGQVLDPLGTRAAVPGRAEHRGHLQASQRNAPDRRGSGHDRTPPPPSSGVLWPIGCSPADRRVGAPTIAVGRRVVPRPPSAETSD